MLKKTVREMTKAERARYSLSARVVRITLRGCVLLGVVALALGMFFYTSALINQHINDAFRMSRSAYSSVMNGADSVAFAEEVMERYHGLSEEERAMSGTEEYRARFADLMETRDYDVLYHMLQAFLHSGGVFDIYLAMYDRETQTLVYIVDPDEENMLYPGEWETVSRKGLEKFLSWDGTGTLYDIGITEKYGWMCTAGVPIHNNAGEPVAFILTDVTMRNIVPEMATFALGFTLTILLVTVFVALSMTRHMNETVVQPLNEITSAAESYVQDKRTGKEEAHFAKIQIHTGDEIENLGLVMADMERGLAEYEKNLTSAVAEKERIATELNMAAEIQNHLLPSVFPPFPERGEFDIYAMMHPAKEVGGDFYDFFMIGEDHLGIVVADVSGNGVPAALFSMIAKTMLKTQAQTQISPERVLAEVNASLCENNEEDMFVTVWFGVLEISTGVLTYADAGHEKLLLYQNGTWSFLPKAGGFALAAYTPEDLELFGEDVEFRNQTIQLGPGDAILQYTDGVTEAMNTERTLFGEERLLDAVNGAPSAEPEELLPYVRKKIDEFVLGAAQFDDITMLGLRMNG